MPVVSTALVASERSAISRDDSPNNAQDVWALLSDTHIPADPRQTGGPAAANPVTVRPVEHLKKVCRDILSGETGAPCGVIVSGDCAFDSGKPDDYATIVKEFKPLRENGMEIHFVMGNHDDRRSFVNAVAGETTTPQSGKRIAERLCAVVETTRANFFLLDSLENKSIGLLGKNQLRWLADNLDARQNKPAILIAHHYPDYTAALASNPHALRDTPELFKIIKDRRQVKAFIFGHSHLWSHLRQHDIHLVNLPATAWRFDIRQPYAWVSMQLRDDGMKLTLRSIETQHPKHNETIDFSWR